MTSEVHNRSGGRGAGYRFRARFYEPVVEPLMRGLREISVRVCPPSEKMKVLDLGCGNGSHLELYRNGGSAVFGVDPSPHMLELARRRLGSQAVLCLGDGRALPLRDSAFDLVVFSMVLHETSPGIRSALVEEAKRVLKPDGRILVVDFHNGPLCFPKGYYIKALNLLIEAAAGFEHFRNYLEFTKNGALTPLLSRHRLVVDKDRVVSGGNLRVCLLRVS